MIRSASARDVVRIAELDAECFPTSPWPIDRFNYDLASPNREIIVIGAAPEASELIVGYAVINFSDEVTDIERIGVGLDHRGRGLARLLLAHVLELAHRAATQRVMLEVAHDNAVALGLYRKMGFIEISIRPGYYHGRVDALVLMKEVAGGISA